MGIRTIAFAVQPHGSTRQTTVTHSVSTASLSPLARRLAEGVDQTLMDGSEAWRVTVQSHLCYRDFVQTYWDQSPRRYAFARLANTPEEHIRRATETFSPQFTTMPFLFVYRWDYLSQEPPEQYFERHAAVISDLGICIRTYREPSWVTPTEAFLLARRCYPSVRITQVGMRFLFTKQRLPAEQDNNKRWIAPLAAVITLLEERQKRPPRRQQ